MARSKNPTGHTNKAQVSGATLLSKRPLRISEGMGFKEGDERLPYNALDHLRNNRGQMDSSVVVRIVNRRFFINRHEMMDSPSHGPL